MNIKTNKAQKTACTKKIGLATAVGALFWYVVGWVSRRKSTHIPDDGLLDLYITPEQVHELLSDGDKKITFDTRRGGVTVRIIDDSEYPDND